MTETTKDTHPRPQWRRSGWLSLNGVWRVSGDPQAEYRHPSQIPRWSRTARVPALWEPELPEAGEGRAAARIRWYERDVETDLPLEDAARVLLHFGSVEGQFSVWINGQYAGGREEGRGPSSLDIKPLLSSRLRKIALRVEGDPLLAHSRGKGAIRQTVWIEALPETYLKHVRWIPDIRGQEGEIACEVSVDGRWRDPLYLKIGLRGAGRLLASDTYEVLQRQVRRRLTLFLPYGGLRELLWSPETPNLIQAGLELWSADRLLDRVDSYTALRKASSENQQFFLNDRPYPIRWFSDRQAPMDVGFSEDSIQHDVERIKKLGYNGVRKHRGIDDPRFLYWSDRLGLLVGKTAPASPKSSPESAEQMTKTWIEVVRQHYNHPSVVAWLLPPGGSGLFTESLQRLTEALDPTRPVCARAFSDELELLEAPLSAPVPTGSPSALNPMDPPVSPDLPPSFPSEKNRLERQGLLLPVAPGETHPLEAEQPELPV